MLKFVEKEHNYFWQEQHVHCVSEVLKAEGACPSYNLPNAEYKRQLGEYVHYAIRLHFENRLDEKCLQGEVKDYFEKKKSSKK